MTYSELLMNWDSFSKLINKTPISQDVNINALIQNYINQNVMFINDILLVSLSNLKKIQNAKSTNDCISIQSQFNYDIHKKISYASQYFLNASIRNNIAYDDEWLRAHCDMATD